MCPIRERHRLPIDVEMVEGVPHPDRLQVCIEIHDDISQYRHRSRVPWQSRRLPNRVTQDNEMAVGRRENIVMKSPELHIESCGGKSCIQILHRELTNNRRRFLFLAAFTEEVVLADIGGRRGARLG